ncbi:phosphatases II [Phellopilus nigrolimitatus]|nr:phosphatases II [Phellopilus nigrolimitatus]
MGWRNHADPVIEGKLYLGNLTTASTPQGLHERKITHIVSACREPIPAHHPQSGYFIYKIPVEDAPTEDLLIHLPGACQFIHNAMQTEGAVVLVHCVQGLSRSACVVAAYLMWSRRLSATDALTVVRQAREQIWLNPSFQEQLVIFEACRYNPHPNDGIYRKWRYQLEEARRRIAAQAASGSSGGGL